VVKCLAVTEGALFSKDVENEVRGQDSSSAIPVMLLNYILKIREDWGRVEQTIKLSQTANGKEEGRSNKLFQ
jgi:hypothetical protein